MLVLITAIWPLIEFCVFLYGGSLNRPPSDQYLGLKITAGQCFMNPPFGTPFKSLLSIPDYGSFHHGFCPWFCLNAGARRALSQCGANLLILPFAMSPALIGVSFRFMFNPEFGLFDAFWRDYPTLADAVGWLINFGLYCLCIADVWGWIRF